MIPLSPSVVWFTINFRDSLKTSYFLFQHRNPHLPDYPRFVNHTYILFFALFFNTWMLLCLLETLYLEKSSCAPLLSFTVFLLFYFRELLNFCTFCLGKESKARSCCNCCYYYCSYCCSYCCYYSYCGCYYFFLGKIT
jgi:hypothetical protein